MSLSCHGPSLLPTGGLWNFIPQMAWVDRQFLLNRLPDQVSGEGGEDPGVVKVMLFVEALFVLHYGGH